MRKINVLMATLAIGCTALSPMAMAAKGDILARFRVINVNPQESTDNTLSDLGVSAKSATVPELDFTYMVTDNIGMELILGTSRHKLKSDQIGDLGKISVLPPTLTAQYHFNPQGAIRPYVGAGINYTRFYNNKLRARPLGQDIKVDNNSWGPALQVGMDIPVSKSIFINVDVKKLWIKTDARLENGTSLGTLKVNPWVFGVGVGTSF